MYIVHWIVSVKYSSYFLKLNKQIFKKSWFLNKNIEYVDSRTNKSLISDNKYIYT